jgi:hypothetical protein
LFTQYVLVAVVQEAQVLQVLKLQNHLVAVVEQAESMLVG